MVRGVQRRRGLAAPAALPTLPGSRFLRRRPARATSRDPRPLPAGACRLHPAAVSGATGSTGPGQRGALGVGLGRPPAVVLLPCRPPSRAQDDPSDSLGLPGGAVLPAHGVRHAHRPGRGVQRRAPRRVGRLLRQPQSRPRPHLLQSAARRPRVPQVQDEGSERRRARLLPVLAGSQPSAPAAARAAGGPGSGDAGLGGSLRGRAVLQPVRGAAGWHRALPDTGCLFPRCWRGSVGASNQGNCEVEGEAEELVMEHCGCIGNLGMSELMSQKQRKPVWFTFSSTWYSST